MRRLNLCLLALGAGFIVGCGSDAGEPLSERAIQSMLENAWGPETPPFNIEAVLRNPFSDRGFGLVKFRQPNDADVTIYLDVWVRDLAPGTSYRLQRAVDTVPDDVCTEASGWLTLGQGLTPQAILTDATGTGRAGLWRSVAAFPVGAQFDINFRIIDDATGSVVLTSDCYQFTISQ
jgi:hypothetical protein